MNKEEVLKQLFQLSKDDILDIFKIINGYKERVNKSRNDTLIMRCLFMKGYHSTKEFYKEKGITKDNMLASALSYETTNIKAYLELKRIFNIGDEMFNKVLLELEQGSDNNGQ